MESGIHSNSSLHFNCYHPIVFAKFNLSIFYPPPYERTVWYYERANTELIRRAIDQFDWFLFHHNAAQQNPTFHFDNRDLPWRNREIKKLLVEKNLEFKSYYCSNKNMFLFEKFKALQCHMNICIEEQNEMHYTKLSRRLADPLTSPKTYCSKTNRFLAHILFFMKTNSSQTSKKKS